MRGKCIAMNEQIRKEYLKSIVLSAHLGKRDKNIDTHCWQGGWKWSPPGDCNWGLTCVLWESASIPNKARRLRGRKWWAAAQKRSTRFTPRTSLQISPPDFLVLRKADKLPIHTSSISTPEHLPVRNVWTRDHELSQKSQNGEVNTLTYLAANISPQRPQKPRCPKCVAMQPSGVRP